jgi:hypothetical protein
MPSQTQITFAVATYGAGEVLEGNFLASPCLRKPHPHQILLQRNYISAAKAYNDAIDRAGNDLMVFAHQDMIFPESWISQLERAIGYVEAEDPRWGVLGCYGATRDGDYRGYVYSPLDGVIGRSFECPIPVQTLDEIVLIVRKSSGLRFDDRLPHFHLYGTDICLRAAHTGMKSYAISAFCIHNAHHYLVLPKEFYECCRYIKGVWKDYLPIQTACVRITRFNIPLFKRRLNEAHMHYIRRKAFVGSRAKDVPKLLNQVDAVLQGRSATSSS